VENLIMIGKFDGPGKPRTR